MRHIGNLILASVIAMGLSACEECIQPKFNEVTNLLTREIQVGDTREKAEEVLKAAGISYSYGEIMNGLYTTLYDTKCGPYDALSVLVQLDKSGRVTKVAVMKSYTRL